MYLQLVETNTHECLVITPHASEQARSSCLLNNALLCLLFDRTTKRSPVVHVSPAIGSYVVALQVGVSAAGVCLTVNQVVSDILCTFLSSTAEFTLFFLGQMSMSCCGGSDVSHSIMLSTLKWPLRLSATAPGVMLLITLIWNVFTLRWNWSVLHGVVGKNDQIEWGGCRTCCQSMVCWRH